MAVHDSLPPLRVATHLGMRWLRTGASALALGAAFGGGILWAGAHGDDDEDAPTGSALAVADEATARLEAVQNRLTFKYPEELQGAPRAGEIDPYSAQDDMEESVAHKPAPPTPPTEESTSGVVPPKPAPKEAPLPAVPAPSADDVPDEAEEALTDKPRESETVEDRTRVAAALATVLGEKAPEWVKDQVQAQKAAAAEPVPQPVPATADMPAAAPHVIQVAATPSEEGAQKLAAELQAKGERVVVQRVDVDGKPPMFRVRVTGFASRDQADAHRAKLGQGIVLKAE